MLKTQKILSIIGFLFIFLHIIYIGGYSSHIFFKYTLIIGLILLTIDLLIYIYLHLKKKKAD